MNHYDLAIIAGPCSITPENTEEIINDIATIETPDGNRAIYGTRVVGLKSRTSLDLNDESMGIDSQVIQKALMMSSEERMTLQIPSVELAEKIAKETDLLIATEIMIPHIQLPFYEQKKVLYGNLLPWNPSVEQLGWNMFEISEFAKRNKWDIGIKHGKFLGKDPLEIANHPNYQGETALEKVTLGLTTYVAEHPGELIIIHRGIDVPRNGDSRNAIAHEIMKRIKQNAPQAKMYFDPTHSIGPKLRHTIIEETILAAKLQTENGFLYDGLLIEAGTSPTDTDEHVTIDELKQLVNELHMFRGLRPPTISQ
ncbi:MAG TPA: hypothetical protein VNW29_06790 [Candidatus Sulfotelmatobacter sp.]|jgi:hypothetical protein|nr:hypothetical protein [Candidatus Sulfotelmatobacter sp.]